MELRGLLKFLQLLLLAETASDVTEGNVGRKRLRVDSFSGFFRREKSWLIFLRFHLSAIFRRENLSALQILPRVDVLRFLLPTFFLGALLTSLFPGGLSSGPHSLSQIRKSKPWENLLSIAEAAKRLGGISKWTLHARFHNVA